MEPRSCILLGLLAVGTLAGPINQYYSENQETSCARQCRGSNKFKYQVGVTYDFDYGVITRTAMSGASEDHASLEISARAHIHILDKCDFSLTLSDVRIKRSNPDSPRNLEFADETGEFRNTLEANPLRFSFQDGLIEEICPEYGESKWSLNIKRGVLSMFQNTMKDLKRDERVQEADVTGTCDTEYRVNQKGWYSINIKKSKNLLGCTGRHGYKTSVQTASYRVPHSIQSLPLMKSIHDCDQEITSEGFLKKSSCHEMHVFRPFSKDNNGAVSEANQRLEFTGTSNKGFRRNGMITHRTSMSFDHSFEAKGEAQSLRDATFKLRELCEAAQVDIRPEVPRLFSDLVYILKNMEASWLESVYNEVKSGYLCSTNSDILRKFYLDALPMIGTRDSIRIMRELMTQREVTNEQSEMWLTSLAFITNPNKEMFSEIVPLLGERKSDNSMKALLSISAMLNNYCELNPNCLDDYEISSIISALEMNIGYTCDVSNEKQKQMIMLTLRAIGNTGRSDRLAAALKKCYTSENPIDVRIAALQAFRRMPCSIDRKPIQIIFENEEVDSELRIAAYLTIMECPTVEVLELVRSRLETEQINQVGSFIWSHLTNLMETASPHKQSIREILEDENLKRNFDLDKRKFSRNYEGSFFFNKFNTGAMVESNLIWSPKSFMPRSASLNLTVDLFGKSVNLLELGGRIEGIEYFLESYLGPGGLFRPPGRPTEYHKSRGIKLEKLERTKRKFDDLKDELRGAMYLRLFGNELKYSSFNGLGDGLEPGFNILDLLIKLSKDHDISFTHSIMIMDSSLIIPTSSGIPLNLTVNGTASVIMKATGSVDLRKLVASPRSLHIHGSVLPSAAVEVTSSMVLDAFVTKTGIKMTSTLHTSTALSGTLDLSRGQIFSLELDTPKQKMEIIDVKSKFFIIHDRVEKEQKMILANYREKKLCSGNRLKTITGLEVCGEVSFPNASMMSNTPYFPFTGPVSMSLTLSKQDIPNGFKIIAKKIQSKEALVAQIALNTPGSKTDRALSVDFVLNHKDKKLEAGFTSPWRKASLKGYLQNDDDRKGANLILVSDRDEYAVETAVNIDKNNGLTKYTPMIELRRPGAAGITLKGTVVSKNNEDISADLKLAGATERAVNMKANFVNTMKMKSITGSVALSPKQVYSAAATVIIDQKKKSSTKLLPTFLIKTPEGTLVSLKGSADHKSGKSFKTDLSLEMDRLLERPIEFTANIMKTNNTRKGSTMLKLRSSTSLNCQAIVLKTTSNTVLKLSKKGKTLSTRFGIDYHMMKSKKKNKIVFSSKLIDRSTNSLNKYIGNANFDVKQNPEYNFNVDMDLNHNKRHSEIDMKVRHGKNVKDKKDKSQELYISGTVNHKINLPAAKVDFTLKTVYPPKKVDYHFKGTHSQGKMFLDSTISVKYGPNKDANITIGLKNETKKFVKIAGIFALDYPGREFRITSDLTQTQKVDYFHSLNVQMNKGEISEVSSTYRNPSSSLHEITSDIRCYKQVPMKFTGTVNLKLKKFILDTTLDRDGKRYGVGLTSDVNTNKPSGKWTIDLNCPYRRVKALVEGGKKGKDYIGKLDTSWDAENDRNQRINADIAFNVQKAWQNNRVGGSVDVSTPFKPFKKISLNYNYVEDPSKFSSIGNLMWDGKKMTSDVRIAKPFTRNNFNISWKMDTPFEGYRSMLLDLDHTLDPILGKISTSFRSSRERHFVEAAISGHGLVTKLRRDITGSIMVKTSVDKYRNFFLKGAHNDDFHIFHSEAIVDLNNDQYNFQNDVTLSKVGWFIQGTGKTSLTSPKCRVLININHRNTRKSIKSTLTTEWGFDGEKLHIDLHSNHQLGERRIINSGLTVESPWEPVKDIEVAMSHDFGDGHAKRNIYYKQDKRIKASLKYNYGRKAEGIDFDFFHSNPYMDDIFGNLNVRPTGATKTGHLELTWAPRQKIMVDGSLASKSKEYYDGELRLMTPFKGFESMIGHFEHDKVSGIWVSKAYAEYGINQKVEVETNIGFDAIRKLRLSVKTPYKEMSHFEGGLEYSGGIKEFHSKAAIKIIPVLRNMGIGLSWNAKDMAQIVGNFRMECPFEGAELLDISLNSIFTDGSRKSTTEITYKNVNDKIILVNMYQLNGWTDFKLGFTLDTPFIQFRHLEADSSFLYKEGLVQAEGRMRTPYKRLEDIHFELRHAHSAKQAQSHVLLKYSPTKEFVADSQFGWAEDVHGEVKVKTPYLGYEITTLKFNHDGSSTRFRTHANVLYAYKEITSDVTFEKNPNVKGTFTFNSPYKKFTNIKAEFSSEGELKNFKATGTLRFGDVPKLIEAALSHKSQKRTFIVDFDLKTPYLEDIKLTVNHNGKPERFSTSISAASGKEYHLDSTAEFNKKKQTLSSKTDLGYIFQGSGKEISFQFDGEGKPENFQIDMNGIYNKKTVNVLAGFKRNGETSIGNIEIKTPFDGYKNLGLNFNHVQRDNLKLLDTRTVIKIMSVNNTVYTALSTMDILDKKHVSVMLGLLVPFEGKELVNKITYQHNADEQQADIDAKIIYKTNSVLSSVINAKMSPYKEFTIKLESPFKNFEKIVGSGSYQKDKLHKVNGQFKVGNDIDITIGSSLDLSTVPVLFSANVLTPYSGFEKIDFSASHQGDHTNFRTSASFYSPKTDSVSATTYFKYFSANEMEGEATFKSSLQNYEDIKLVLRQAVRNNFNEKRVVVGYAPGKEIFIDGSYKFENNWRGRQINGEFNLKTPFNILKDFRAKMDHTHSKQVKTDSLSADYNGKTYLDAMSRYSYSTDKKADYRFDIKEPRPMLLTISGLLDNNSVDFDAFINWNKNDIDSNFKIITLFKNDPHPVNLDRTYKFRLVHPARTIGFEGNFINNDQTYKSHALVTWDEKEGNTFSYDIQMHNKTTRYRKGHDGSLKIRVPMRAVKVTSGFTDGRGVRAYDMAVFWDADRDEAKQIGSRVSVEVERPIKKVDISLFMPSIDKTYKLSTEASAGVGSSIFYGKSEFSYHPNPSHNVIVTTKVENMAVSQLSKNYSLFLSLSHPVTGIDVKMTSHAGRAEDRVSAGSEFLYLAADKQTKNFALRGEIDRLRKTLNFEVLSPIKSVEIHGEATAGIPSRFTLRNTYDQRKHVTADLMVDSNKKELDFIMNYNPDDPEAYININGHYVNSTFIQAEIFRQLSGERYSEGTVALRLNTSNIIHTKLTWRPTVIPELQQLISNKIQSYTYFLNNIYAAASEAIGKEVNMKYNVVSREMGQEMAPVMHFLDTEMKSMEGQLTTIRRELRRFYDRNDLHIKDMGRTINEWFTEVFTAYRELLGEFRESYKELEAVMKEVRDVVQRYPIRERYQHLIGTGMALIKQFQQRLTARINDLMYRSDEYSAALYAKYRASTRHLQRILDEITRTVTENPHIKIILEKYNQISNKLNYVPEIDFGKLSLVVDNSIQSSLSPQMVDAYKSVVYNIRSIIKSQLQDLMQQKEFKQMYDVSKELHAQAIWAYKYWDVDENFKLAMRKALELTKEVLFEEIDKLKNGLINLKKSRMIIFDTQRGEVQFELYLPIPLKSLEHPPHLGIKNYIRKVHNFVNNYMPTKNSSFWDVYYNNRLGSKEMSTWLPPFRAYASVVGDQHFVTFDQRHFDFAGRCSYVLARDMKDDNFTVVMNYDNEAHRKSIMVLFKGLTLEVDNNNQLLANDRKVELPFVSESVSAVNNLGIIRMSDGLGLTVDIDTKHEIYSIGVPGWYFGKVAGLLGTYDNEGSNDMTTSEDKTTKDLHKFASSWEIGRRRCLTENNARQIEKIDIPDCNQLFSDNSSPFRACYGQVKPDAYRFICVDYIANKRYTDGHCKAARQYIGECLNRGVFLNMPNDCVSCEGPNGNLKPGNKIELSTESADPKQSTPSSADIIFIVEEKQCNRESAAMLPNVVSSLEAKLNENGIRRNRYGLVGYGGDNLLHKEHINTIESGEFAEARVFLKGTENLRLGNSTRAADNQAAIRLATGYPFRVGVSKILVLLPCSVCNFDLRHVDMNNLLKTQGFTLHLLRSENFTLPADKAYRGIKIYGMDGNSVHSSKPESQDLVYGAMSKPIDLCANLALQTNGSIFDVSHLITGRSRLEKQFLNAFVDKVQAVARPPACQVCECKANGQMNGRTVCRPCEHSFTLWDYIPYLWKGTETAERGVFEDQIQEFFEAVKKNKDTKAL